MGKGAALAVLPVLVMIAGVARGGDLADIAEHAKQNSLSYRNMELSDQVRSGAAQADAARKAADLVNSKGFQKRLGVETERLKHDVFGGVLSSYYGELATGGERKSRLADNERVYIFVSSSMPVATLRAYARNIDRAGDPNVIMVLRGFVGGGGSFAPTMTFISRVLLRDPDCTSTSSCPSFAAAIEIDPNLNRRFRPERVPAVVFVRGVHLADAERSEGDPTNVPNPEPDSWWMLYGDPSLSYALARINEEAHSPGLEELIRALAR